MQNKSKIKINKKKAKDKKSSFSQLYIEYNDMREMHHNSNNMKHIAYI